MARLTLHDLIEALSNAVIEAQDRVERAQIRNIRQFFKQVDPEPNDAGGKDDQGYRPLTFKLLVPSTSPAAKHGDEQIIGVPLITLIAHSQLAIETFRVTMDVELSEVAENRGVQAADARTTAGVQAAGAATTDEDPAKTLLESPATPLMLSVDLTKPRIRRRGPTAKVTLRVRSREPTEGMARMLAELNKRIGVE